ncbi:unnamed protein product [Rotaria magnacalcarata]
MFQRNHGIGNTNIGSTHQAQSVRYPQWELISGKVVSYRNSTDVFRGNEILEVSVVGASLMDAPSVLLGRQKILLQPGQRFPVRFQFYYDKSRAEPGYGGRMMQANVTNINGQLFAWIDSQGLFVELPLMISFIPERWTLPSIVGSCLCATNIMPAIITWLRWYEGKRFSEIPYIYMIITIATLLFDRERSIWLIGSVFTLSMLDCTLSLLFFDYMKRFRTQYLTAVSLGEGLTGLIPTILLLIQGIGGESSCASNINGTIVALTFTQPSFSITVYMLLIASIIGIGGESSCASNINGTTVALTFTQPRFSITVYMLLIASIIVGLLLAFVLLRWTSIISLADAGEPVK